MQDKKGNLRLSFNLSRLSYSTVDCWEGISNDGGISKPSSLSDEYGIIISTVNAFPNDFLSTSHCSPECALPSWCLSGIAGVATCHQGPLLKVVILAKIAETAINCQIVNDILKKMAKAFWKWHIGRKWQKWRRIAKFLTKIQMRWQRGPFESGDFGENGRNGEQSPNLMKEDHRSYRRNFCSCEKKAWKNSGLYEIPALNHCNTDAAFYQLS